MSLGMSSFGTLRNKRDQSSQINIKKRKKVTHARSDLLSILERRCSQNISFEQVTEYVASRGLSAIDVAFSTFMGCMI